MNQNLKEAFKQLISTKNNEIDELKKDKEKNAKEIKQLTFKIIIFRKALTAINKYPTEIKCGEDLRHEKGIGNGIIKRIDEILEKGTLEEEIKDNQNTKNKFNQVEELLKITGIGPSKANALIKENITLQILLDEIGKIEYDLARQEESEILQKLTHHQLIGLKYFEDILLRIPREEIQKIEKKLVKYIGEIDPKLEIIICGSYRREKDNSGDIDMLILHPDIKTEEDFTKSEKKYLLEVVEILTKKKLLVDNLTDKGETKYMGLCRLSKTKPARRIDIRFINYISKAAALLYFTGSGDLNKNMRSDALKQGYTINEYGIYKLRKDKKKGKMMNVNTEKDIFDLIDMDYLEPKDR